jgi:hypothetical protein
MSRSIHSDKSIQRAMLAAFGGIDRRSDQRLTERAITRDNLRVCSRECLEFCRSRYVAAFGKRCDPAKLALFDKAIAARLRMSPTERAKAEAALDVSILFTQKG